MVGRLRTALLSAALGVMSMVTAAHGQAAIDAQQFCGRTPGVRAAILEAVQGATATCIEADPNANPPVEARYETTLTAGQLAGITFLDLTSRFPAVPFIKEFKPGDFDGLTELRAIDLVEQPLRGEGGLAQAGVPTDVLGRLEKLVYSNSNVNRIESADFFQGLSNLRVLNITTNNMVYELPGNPNRPESTAVGRGINPEAWKLLPNLRTLRIGSNRILTLPRGFFRHLTMLEELDMFDMWYEYHPYGFGSQALPAGIFEGLTRLRKLDLGYNAIGAAPVDDGLFDGLMSLQELDLRDNPLLETLPTSVLSLPPGVTIRTDPGVAWPTQEGNRAATGAPVISGTARVGETLTALVLGIADADGLSGASFAYQWLSNDGSADTEIEDATAASYTVLPTEAGKTIKVRVTFTDNGGTEESLVSEATAPVTAEPAEVSITAAASPITEGTAATFTLTRTGATAAALTVAVHVAESGAMLAGSPPASVTFGVNDGSTSLSVGTADDAVVEPASIVTAVVGAGSGYTVAAGG